MNEESKLNVTAEVIMYMYLPLGNDIHVYEYPQILFTLFMDYHSFAVNLASPIVSQIFVCCGVLS